MIKRLFLAAILLLVAGCTDASDNKQRGTEAANDGRYAEAYKLWLPLAKEGDAEVQEALALLLVGDIDVGVSLSRPERERLALGWIALSAKGGNKSAMTWLGQALQNGWHGLPKDGVAAACWLEAAKAQRSSATCVVPVVRHP